MAQYTPSDNYYKKGNLVISKSITDKVNLRVNVNQFLIQGDCCSLEDRWNIAIVKNTTRYSVHVASSIDVSLP